MNLDRGQLKLSRIVKKTYVRTYAPSEVSYQSAHPRSLIRIFTFLDAKFLNADNECSAQTAHGRTCQKVRFS